MTETYENFAVIGGGAWGTALASTLIRGGRKATLWARSSDVVQAINSIHANPKRLPGVLLDARLKATAQIADVQGADAFVIATPAQHVRTLLGELKKQTIKPTAPIIITAKGIEAESLKLLAAVVGEVLPENPTLILSGPSFAVEVARGLPTALTLASRDMGLAEALAVQMATQNFRLYITDDVVGVEIGGAVKNVLAIACGVVEGRKLGENARAALITRGLSELTRLGLAMGARMETMMGLAGMGDLVLTCSSTQSRNMSLGAALGQGQKLADILASRTSVSEGVTTAAAARKLADQAGVEMPIVAAVDAILNGGVAINDVISALLSRPLRQERV